ncbi:alanine racemase [Salinivibrio sp. YCSC6]|uniref:alanine racemase n=1 Tax=Salinivibrio sp. YCSC6 TaxID=2003370 RepID=UPI000BBC7E83|nr:alanine racemase [Salinivibrio sp. YCSC6]PCE68205.1 alanine racemase [Salinivibrio sp. YCSC6]QCF34906.1 alanine racemase [Salinivibrio sp. YCSC6]
MNKKLSLVALAVAGVVAVGAPAFLDYSSSTTPTTDTSSSRYMGHGNGWLEVNTATFNDNIQRVQQQLSDGTKMCVVMKADAYGNGIAGLLPVVIANGIDCVGIASNEEARTLREGGFTGEIMRVRTATLQEMESGLALNMQELVGSAEQAEQMRELADKHDIVIPVHMAFNAGGMGRNGIEMESEYGKQLAMEIATDPRFNVVGIMTHFPNYSAKYVRSKLGQFKSNSDWLIEQANLKREDVLIHAANSFVTLNVPEGHFDMVRPGGVLYGDQPTNREFPPIMSFKTKVASLHHLPAGSTVGYDSTYTVERDSILANLPVGYSDGFPRKMGNNADVLIKGHRVPVVGVSSMNTIMVDVTDIADQVTPNDEVVLFGQQGDETIGAVEYESNADVIFPEIYSWWGAVNPREYVQ